MKFLASCLRSLPWLMALLLVAVAGGCGGGGGSGNSAGSAAVTGQGTLGVSLTDMPACGFDAVNVTVRKVRVHQSSSASDTDGGWTDITLNPAQKINLLDLTNGVLLELGQTPLAAAHYTQIRLVLVSNGTTPLANSIVPTGGVETELVTPSAVQSGIKLVHEFDVPAGQRVDLVLDFDACRSIVKRGNGTFGLKPVIRVTPLLVNGITGFVDTSLPISNVMVSAQQGGNIVQATVPNAQTGAFFLARLAAGNYDVVFTADDHATSVISGVPIADTTSIVPVSTSAAPITLQSTPVPATHKVSGTVKLDPSLTTDAEVVARQTLGTGPTVTVKSVFADESVPNPYPYQLILPIGAPQLGAYSTTLPIVFVAQAGAGVYTVEASASGYTTQSFSNVNISVADAVQNFELLLIP